jgi:3-deoxy-D-arabino-heptulosonate 7-phosphate (DAHP) synthase class II
VRLICERNARAFGSYRLLREIEESFEVHRALGSKLSGDDTVTTTIDVAALCGICIVMAALSSHVPSAGVHLEMTYEHVTECDDDFVHNSDDALASDANVLYTSSCDPRYTITAQLHTHVVINLFVFQG